MNLELNAEQSHYIVGKNQVPRVTHVLKTLNLVRYPDDPAAMALGSATHLGIRYLLENRLDWKTLDPLVLPRVQAAQKFCTDLDVHPIAIEKPVCSNLGYAGRPDLVCSFGKTQERCIIDWKNGKPQAAAALQLVAYAGASTSAPIGRMTVELRDDATYNLVVWPASRWFADWKAWLAALTLYQWINQQRRKK